MGRSLSCCSSPRRPQAPAVHEGASEGGDDEARDDDGRSGVGPFNFDALQASNVYSLAECLLLRWLQAHQTKVGSHPAGALLTCPSPPPPLASLHP